MHRVPITFEYEDILLGIQYNIHVESPSYRLTQSPILCVLRELYYKAECMRYKYTYIEILSCLMDMSARYSELIA